jgi:hypothetical protein
MRANLGALDDGVSSAPVEPFAPGVLADLLKLLPEILQHGLGLLIRLDQLFDGVEQGECGGVVTAAAERAAQVAEVGGSGQPGDVELIGQVARPFLGVG